MNTIFILEKHNPVDSIAASLYYNWLSWQIASDEKIKITLLILRWGVLSRILLLRRSWREQKHKGLFTFITTTQKQGSQIQSKLLLVLSEHSGSANPTIGVISDLSFHLIKDDLGVALWVRKMLHVIKDRTGGAGCFFWLVHPKND